MELYLISLLAILSLVVLSAILSIEAKELMHSVFFLGVFLVTIGALYILLGAEFIGVIQILLYAGGVAVLMLFSLMLLPRRGEKEVSYRIPAIAVVMIFIAMLFLMIGKASPPQGAAQVSTEALALTLLSQYPLLIILLALLIVVIMVSASYLVGGER
ncbi:MAG: NADH-quinone oxidoreductase subunit J family protein [Candidatus Njordarchaeales archaeon]